MFPGTVDHLAKAVLESLMKKEGAQAVHLSPSCKAMSSNSILQLCSVGTPVSSTYVCVHKSGLHGLATAWLIPIWAPCHPQHRGPQCSGRLAAYHALVPPEARHPPRVVRSFYQAQYVPRVTISAAEVMAGLSCACGGARRGHGAQA